MVVLGSVWFVGGVGEVVDVVELVVNVGGGLVWEVFDDFSNRFGLASGFSIVHGGLSLHVFVGGYVVVEFPV